MSNLGNDEQEKIDSTTDHVPVSGAASSTLSPEIQKYLEGKIDIAFDDFEKKIDKRFHDKEVKTNEILAVFITLFTFISVNVQIFTKISDLMTAIFFMILMTLCSVIMLALLFIVIRLEKNDYRSYWILIGSVALLFFFGLIMKFGFPEFKPNPDVNNGGNKKYEIQIF